MLADGLSYRAIAGELGILEASIKTRMWAVLTKLGADSTAQAVAMGMRRGLID
jgi:DNA-binding NarL/FixJ family response regulator